jgi:hypothetical protein
MHAVGDATGLRTPFPGAAEGALHRDDLIDDRALTDEEDDEFRLCDIVSEVAQLCESVPVPATVAVYGSWGSGKSSLANLLGERLRKNKKVAFARFDAFKYAEVPLRRQFISQLAAEFRIRRAEFLEGLYSTTRDVRFRAPPRKWLGLLAALAIASAITLAVVGVAAVLYAIIADGPFSQDIATALRASIPGIALATPLLAAGLALLGSYFTAETTTDAPSSDEQFERLFRRLVIRIRKKRRCKRIVVFIDELDRCSPDQVVSALETLRTFLEVKPCIFIVAADQQVLEQALRRAPRQATPFNAANPYYSAGSAYLDKIFQYQLGLPPVLPRRLSRFALDLIEGRQGVWAQVPNQPDLVSVLVPTHVSSPRRVKALLNSFALLFRLALKRSEAQVIESGIGSRASEIAKLSCLRTEFPLFAADLRLDARLPEIVLWLHDNEDESDEAVERRFLGFSPEALVRARAYAREELPVDEVIAREPPRRQALVGLAEGQASSTDSDDEEAADDSGDDERAKRAEALTVEKSQARQLIRYLRRTNDIAGPRRDLIYLESPGAAFDLPSELAEQLERAALDGATEAVEATFAQLSETEAQNAFRLFARLLVEAIGIEAANIARAIFRAVATYEGALVPIAGELVTALVRHGGGYSLDPSELERALALALADDGRAARQLRAQVIARDEVVEDEELAAFVLSRTDELRGQRKRLAEVLKEALSRERAEDAAQALADVGDTQVVELIGVTELDSDEAVEGATVFTRALHARERVLVAQAAFARLVASDVETAGEAAAELVGLFAPISEPGVASSMLSRGRRLPATEWSPWLAALDDATVARIKNAAEFIDDYARRLWQARFHPETGELLELAEFDRVAKEIGRLRTALIGKSEARLDLLQAEATVLTSAEVTVRQEQYEALETMVEAGALEPAATAASVLTDLAGTLTSPQPGTTGTGAMTEYVLAQAETPLASAQEDAVASFLEAAEESPWLDATALEILRVRCALARRRLVGAKAAPPQKATLMALVDAENEEGDEALAAWITNFAPEATIVFELLAPRIRDGARLPARLTRATQAASGTWTPRQKADLLATFVGPFLDGQLDESIIAAASLGDADADGATETLVAAYQAASNNEQRRAVMELWREVNPSPATMRRKLIDSIYIPLLEGGKDATRIALSFFALVRDAPTQAARDRIKRAVRAAVAGDKTLEKRAEKMLRDAGWISKKRVWFKKG